MAGSYARIGPSLRVTWTVLHIIVVQTMVCGVAMVPSAAAWYALDQVTLGFPYRVLVTSLAIVPLYALFALALAVVSPLANRLTGARTDAALTIPLAGVEPPVLRWVRYVSAIRVVAVLAGPLLRGSPLWTAYLRLNGARIGRRVYINTLQISDHNLLAIGDDVVIGANVCLSGHTVESGLLKTGRVVIGNRVTIGLGSVIDIDVRVGDGAQIGALSLVTKHMSLDADTTYAGIPATARRRHSHQTAT